MKIRIGSRESRLAVIQSRLIMDRIAQAEPQAELELVTMKTTGDKILDKTLDKIGGKGAAFGKYSEGEQLECAWPAVFYGDVAVSGALTVNGETVEALAYPVGSVRLTDSAAPPETADGLTWESVETGIAGVYGWRRTS